MSVQQDTDFVRVIIEFPAHLAEYYSEWRDCGSVRIRKLDDNTARLDVQSVPKKYLCSSCDGSGTWDGMGFRARCKHCGGTGRK